MGLENLKSVFNELSENTLSEKGIHGGLTNKFPSTPPHPEEHSLLDLLPNVPGLGPDNESMNPTLGLKGRHGGLTNESPSTPAHSKKHSILDELPNVARVSPDNQSMSPTLNTAVNNNGRHADGTIHFDKHSILDELPNVARLSPENESMNPTLDLKGRHGGLTNEAPSTPLHSKGHSKLDNLPNVARVSPENLSMNPTLDLKGRHGGLTNEFPPTPPHPDGHSELDNIEKNLAAKLEFQQTATAGKIVFPDNGSVDYSPLMLDSIGTYSGLDTFNEDKITKRTFDGIFPNELGKSNKLGSPPDGSIKDGPWVLESLYNIDHTAVVNRTPIDTGRLDKDGNKIEINTLRSGMGALSNLDIMGYRSGKLDNYRGFDRGDEPYIIKPIGSKDYTTLTSREGLPFHRAKDDTSRLLKFYGTGAGLAFIAKENITNTLIGKFDFFNPLSSVMAPPFANPIQGNTGFLNFTNDAIQDLGNTIGSLRKPLVIEYSKRAQTKIPFGVLGDQTFGVAFVKKAVVPTDQPNIVQKGLRKLKDAVIDKLETAAQVPYVEKGSRFFDISGGGRHTDIGRGYRDEFSRKDPIEEPEQKSFEDGHIKRGDFYVRIKDLRTGGKLLYFRGFVTGITENVSPSFTPTNYIGRSEPVYQYERSERDLSFNLRVYPANETEFTSMYEKIEYLTSLGYPNYLDDGAGLTRMQAPFTELYMAHIGSKAVGQFGFIKSLTYTINETGDWDALQSLPRLFDIAISYQILNKKPSSMATEFYGSTAFYGDKR